MEFDRWEFIGSIIDSPRWNHFILNPKKLPEFISNEFRK